MPRERKILPDSEWKIMKTIHLFIPCFVDQLFPKTGIATVRLLEAAGYKTTFPKAQTCCGQPAFNSGFWKQTAELAERFIRLFADAEYIVTPSASCAAMVRKHYHELDLSDDSKKLLESITPRLFELSEFLVQEANFNRIESRFPHRVAYHTSCHGFRELGILDQPLSLLRNVRGIDLVELDDNRRCCGFGGTFAVKFPAVSVAMGEDKIQAILDSGADVVTATDDSCLMHIEGIITRKKLPIRVLHYSRILAGEELLA